MNEILLLLFQIGLVFGPHIGYVFQYREIAQTKNIEGYAPLTSLILLTSNTLRIYYYFGHVFATALLLQAIFAIAVHGALLLKVLSIKSEQADVVIAPSSEINVDAGRLAGQDSAANAAPSDSYYPKSSRLAPSLRPSHVDVAADVNVFNNTSTASRRTAPTVAAAAASASTMSGKAIDGGDRNNCVCVPGTAATPILEQTSTLNYSTRHHFFLVRWVEFMEEWLIRKRVSFIIYSYFTSIIVTSIVVWTYYAIFLPVWSSAPEVIGYIALGIEATLVVPQIMRNARRHSTSGLTLMLVLTWVLGDSIKLVYFILDKQPLPFKICTCVQLCLDFVIVLQLFLYGRAEPPVVELPGVDPGRDDGGNAMHTNECCRAIVSPQSDAAPSPADSNLGVFTSTISAVTSGQAASGFGRPIKTKQQQQQYLQRQYSEGFIGVDDVVHKYPNNYMSTVNNSLADITSDDNDVQANQVSVPVTV